MARDREIATVSRDGEVVDDLAILLTDPRHDRARARLKDVNVIRPQDGVARVPASGRDPAPVRRHGYGEHFSVVAGSDRRAQRAQQLALRQPPHHHGLVVGAGGKQGAASIHTNPLAHRSMHARIDAEDRIELRLLVR